MRRTINFIGWLHHKNLEGAKLFKDFDVEFNGSSRDVVVNTDSLNGTIGEVTIYGPHIDFREVVRNENGVLESHTMNMLSGWNEDCAKKINPNLKTKTLPFPVNVDKFEPSKKDQTPIVYFKRRDPNILREVLSFIYERFENVRLFDYEARYSEDDYMSACASAPFCIWIGCHESQGFALQECLSSNTPILVIDVNSLYDEINPNGSRAWTDGSSMRATTASYFDESCGLITKVDNWKNDYKRFIDNLNKYNPRNYILNTLSSEVLGRKWLDCINEIATKK